MTGATLANIEVVLVDVYNMEVAGDKSMVHPLPPMALDKLHRLLGGAHKVSQVVFLRMCLVVEVPKGQVISERRLETLLRHVLTRPLPSRVSDGHGKY
jgi:hypothetical protein